MRHMLVCAIHGKAHKQKKYSWHIRTVKTNLIFR
jgi:hypothetical protein